MTREFLWFCEGWHDKSECFLTDGTTILMVVSGIDLVLVFFLANYLFCFALLRSHGLTCLTVSDQSHDDDPIVVHRCFLLRFGVGVGQERDCQNTALLAERFTNNVSCGWCF